jgi:geranylgeranyl diphosphate synthase type II
MIPLGDQEHPAYRAILDYPLRTAKGLRPALAIATCRALGGNLSDIVATAAVLELLHNAFLVHDDVEDGSELRRHAPTLAVQLGVPRAVHAGDTMMALALGPLLDNMRLLDMGRALRILEVVNHVMRRTVEGQALELAWIAEGRWDITPHSYVEMVKLKTAWYTFAAPLMCGAIVAEAAPDVVEQLREFALCLGVAFQIRDDTLNLLADARETGKERWGDLWEGKRTLILALFFEDASPADAELARSVLRKGRPSTTHDAIDEARVDRALDRVASTSALDPAALQSVRDAFRVTRREVFKNAEEVGRLRTMLDASIDRATRMSLDFARRAGELWSTVRSSMTPSIHRDLIESILDYTIVRNH